MARNVRNAHSTPPITSNSFAAQNLVGSPFFAMPRYTLHAFVSFPILITALLIKCNVVV